ncbi:MAG: carboxypeptidase-like regulatory domain-containing protein, partial [Calditrichaeota bacterium]|nr:carboxypeptidase-like regulatory domain-containing protein [Calditrichota bacterium]
MLPSLIVRMWGKLWIESSMYSIEAKRFCTVLMRSVIFACIFVHLFSPTLLGAEVKPGRVRGVVLDRTTREPVALASVMVVGSSRGAGADENGRFVIEDLAPGVYHLRASAIGYNSDTKSEILIHPGRTAEVEFLLEPSVIEAQAVTVTTGFFETSPDLPT